MSERRSKIHHLAAGDVLFREGDSGNTLYKILTGKIGIYADFGTAHAMQLTVLTKGRCFGEMSILEELPRSTTAVAEEDTSLITYPADLLSEVILQNPGFALELMENLSARLRSSTTELERMHKMLLNLSSKGSTDRGMDEYIRQHTTLRPDGVPRFYLSV